MLISPKIKPPSKILYNIVTVSDAITLKRYTATLNFDLTPPTDERPFFFNQLPLYRPIQARRFAMEHNVSSEMRGGIWRGNLLATATLLMIFSISLALVVATIIIPLRSAIRDAGVKLVSGGTWYFILIGIGFMLVEIALHQRFTVISAIQYTHSAWFFLL